MNVMMAYPTCKYRAVARVVMVGVLGSECCTCSSVLALVCCLSGSPLLHRLFIDSSTDCRWRGKPHSD